MKRAAALGVALLALLLCTGCGSSSAATRKTTETMRISAILPHNDYGYWTMVAGGINEGVPPPKKIVASVRRAVCSAVSSAASAEAASARSSARCQRPASTSPAVSLLKSQ